jgi:hypothetical protein
MKRNFYLIINALLIFAAVTTHIHGEEFYKIEGNIPWDREGQATTVSFDGQSFLALIVTGDATTHIASSPDGISWKFYGAIKNCNGREICFGNGKYLIFDSENRILKSNDLINWSLASQFHPAFNSLLWSKSLKYLNGEFGISAGFLGVSKSGEMWDTNYEHPFSGVERTASGEWLTFASGIGVFTSGEVQRYFPAPKGQVLDMCFANGKWLAIRYTTTAIFETSKNAIDWEEKARMNIIPGNLTYGTGRFLVGTRGQGILASSDGEAWSKIFDVKASYPYSTFGKGKFLFAGENLKFLITSTEEIRAGIAIDPAVQLSFSMELGKSYLLENSEDFITWRSIQTFKGSNDVRRIYIPTGVKNSYYRFLTP